MRLFIAIVPPDCAVRALAGARDSLRRALPSGRFVGDAQLHVTLKFLGETPGDAVTDIIEAMGAAASAAVPMRLGVGPMGAFGGGPGRVAYCGVTGEIDKLRALHAALEGALQTRGFPAEGRRFTPHFTLARDVKGFAPLPVEPVCFIAPSMTLFHSDLSRGPPRYAPLHEAPFCGGC